jgi:hypothetical protein
MLGGQLYRLTELKSKNTLENNLDQREAYATKRKKAGLRKTVIAVQIGVLILIAGNRTGMLCVPCFLGSICSVVYHMQLSARCKCYCICHFID